jgi:hypothetical protein
MSSFKSLFKKLKIINTIKEKKGPDMCVDYIQTEVYCFKVKNLFRDDFLILSETCLKDFNVRLYFNTQFNIIQFYELDYSINNIVFDENSSENINSKNFCKKLKDIPENDLDNLFPRNVKECRYYLKTKLEVTEEGVYKLNYLSF